jgi:hypothetical protein
MSFDINKELAKPEHKACGPRGADRGRRNRLIKTSAFIYLQRMRMNSGQAYDAGGAYWGHGVPIWIAASEDMTFFATTRAETRYEAKDSFNQLFRINETPVNWAK